MPNLKKVILLCFSIIFLSACDTESFSDTPEIDGDYIYAQSMCKYNVVAEEAYVKTEVLSLLSTDDTFTTFVNDACNSDTPQSTKFSNFSDNKEIVDIDAGENREKALIYNIPTGFYPNRGNDYSYTNLRYLATDWESNGVVKASRVTGFYDDLAFDVIFTYQTNWVNSGSLVTKEVISNGNGILDSNFDATVTKNNAFINSVVTSSNTDFHNLIESYCEEYSSSQNPFVYNSGNGSIYGTSTFNTIIYQPNLSTLYYLENMKVTNDQAFGIQFKFDVRDSSNNLYPNHIFDCN